MLLLSALFIAAAFADADNESLTITRTLQEYSEKSCSLVRAHNATDEQLLKVVYLPLAHHMLNQMKEIFAPAGKPAVKRAGDHTTYQADTPPETFGEEVGAMKAPDENMITNAAGGVADTVIDNYREAYRQRNHEAPATPSYHDSLTPKGKDRAIVSTNIRDYCGKLADLGITELFPRKQESRRSDTPLAP